MALPKTFQDFIEFVDSLIGADHDQVEAGDPGDQVLGGPAMFGPLLGKPFHEFV